MYNFPNSTKHKQQKPNTTESLVPDILTIINMYTQYKHKTPKIGLSQVTIWGKRKNWSSLGLWPPKHLLGTFRHLPA